jgi:hypothetical protein
VSPSVGNPAKAALFAFCLGLLASSAVPLIKAALPAEHGPEAVAERSAYFAALDIQQVHRGMMSALPAPQWQRFRDAGAADLAAALRRMARAIDQARYRKARRWPKKPTTRKAYKNSGHGSCARKQCHPLAHAPHRSQGALPGPARGGFE